MYKQEHLVKLTAIFEGTIENPTLVISPCMGHTYGMVTVS